MFTVLQGSVLPHITKVYSCQPLCRVELFMKTYLLSLWIWKMTHFQMKSLLCNANAICGRENTSTVRVQIGTGNKICSKDPDSHNREVSRTRLEDYWQSSVKWKRFSRVGLNCDLNQLFLSFSFTHIQIQSEAELRIRLYWGKCSFGPYLCLWAPFTALQVTSSLQSSRNPCAVHAWRRIRRLKKSQGHTTVITTVIAGACQSEIPFILCHTPPCVSWSRKRGYSHFEEPASA